MAMQMAIRMIERGVIDPGKIVSHRVALKEIHKAMEIMATPDRNKVIILP
jgi:threonine dehydrogenase-like Zn-dependent dehydrogenase